MSRKAFAASLLLIALSARAQLEVRPTLALPSAPGGFALAPSAVIAPSAALAPALAAAPPAGFVAPPPAQAHAAALSGALADFARTDMKAAPAGDAHGAGETLMLRAMGANAPDSAVVFAGPIDKAVPSLAASGPSVRRVEPKVYLLSKPLHEPVQLGRGAVAFQIAIAVLWEAAKASLVAYGAYKAGSSVADVAAAVTITEELALSSGSIAVRSLTQLGWRYWRRKLAVLRELARTPQVSRITVMTTGPVTWIGPIAKSKDNSGLIFIEADGELPETLGRFGAPIPLKDTASTRVRLSFVQDGTATASVWASTLKDMLEGRPIPPEIAAGWRGQAKGKERIEATLIGADGSERKIGVIAEGPGARKLIGLGRLDRLRSRLGLNPASRAIPLSDTSVERPGDERESGALRRAWRRLTGRLIVAKN